MENDKCFAPTRTSVTHVIGDKDVQRFLGGCT